MASEDHAGVPPRSADATRARQALQSLNFVIFAMLRPACVDARGAARLARA